MAVTLKKISDNPDAVLIKRVLLSQACADAFCYKYEFSPPASLQVVQSHYESSEPIGITDDTQMALFGLYGLHEASRFKVTAINSIVKDHVLQSYLDWYESQQPDAFRRQTVLTKAPMLHVRRAPGNTCMGSLGEIYSRGTRKLNNSKGNGGVMRSLPFVFADKILGVKQDECYQLAVAAGQLTHDHIESSIATYAFVRLCHLLLQHQLQSLNEPFQSFYWAFPSLKSLDAVAIICKQENTFTAGPALKAAIAAFLVGCSYTAEDGYKAMLEEVAMGGGDADTIAAMAGALWGCYGNAVPHKLIVRLLERSIIERMVNHMF